MNPKELETKFKDVKQRIFELIEEKNIDVDLLSFDLGIDRISFIENMSKIDDNYEFYLRTLELVEKWEG
jgi:hypothetical protein